jgi:predicted dehydrogenase
MRDEAGQSPRVVVRGAGSIGRRHARVFAGLGADVQLWPVRPRGQDRPEDPSGSRLIGDADGPSACAAADLVVVATDTGRHVHDAVAALDAGCARLLVEKPVAPTAADARPLQQHPAADRVFVAAPLRAHACFGLLRARLAAGSAPAAAYVWAQSWLPDWRPERDYRESYSARADEGGVLRDLVHEIDYLTALLGPPVPAPGRPAAILSYDGPLQMAAEQAATLLWATERTSVVVRLDYITRPARRGVRFSGPDGSLTWDVQRATVRWTSADGLVEEQHCPGDLDRDLVMATQARAALDRSPTDPPDQLLGAGAPATLEEGGRAVRICDDARSAGSRR